MKAFCSWNLLCHSEHTREFVDKGHGNKDSSQMKLNLLLFQFFSKAKCCSKEHSLNAF